MNEFLTGSLGGLLVVVTIIKQPTVTLHAVNQREAPTSPSRGSAA